MTDNPKTCFHCVYWKSSNMKYGACTSISSGKDRDMALIVGPASSDCVLETSGGF